MPEKLRKLLAKASEIRTKLLQLSGDDIAEQRAKLTGELVAAEQAIQTALAEPDPANEPENRNGGEGAEFRALEQRVSLANYIGAAWEGRSIAGAEVEFNQALEMGMDRFPLRLLAPRAEHRATTDTDTAVRPVRWVDRVFADTAAQHLGITFDTVAPGVSSHPVTTAGASAAQRGKAEAATDTAWTIGVTEMKPKRNTVRAVFTIEDVARIPGLEEALQRDLRMAMTEGVDRAVFIGDSGASGTDSDITGLQTASISERTLTQAQKVMPAATLAEFLALVDGIHAGSLAELGIVASVGANTLWGSTIANSAAENQTVAQFLTASGMSWKTRGNIETATLNGDFAAFIGRKRGITGAGVVAMWSAGTLVRDPYSGAGKGEVSLTLHYAWDLAFPRTSNFARLKFVT